MRSAGNPVLALVSALKKLARQNYAEPAPSPLLVKLEYSHPSLSQRIVAIEEKIEAMGKAYPQNRRKR